MTSPIVAMAIIVVVGVGSAPTRLGNVEKTLENFLELYYEEYVQNLERNRNLGSQKVDFMDEMQGDQPVEERGNQEDQQNQQNMSEYIRIMKNRNKETWIQILKDNILRQIGRANTTISKPENLSNIPVNISQILPNIFNSTSLISDDQITEKMRSYYPSCELPVNTDQDVWRDDEVMNLYFNFENPDGKNTNIATATLRLYRLPQNSTKFSTTKADCDTHENSEEEKLLRVSIYWYTRSLKKSKRVKRRLSDSVVVPDGARWAELSIRPAVRAWSRGKNLGLAVLVEDQEGNSLKAEQYFKGTSCTQPQNQSQQSWSTRHGNQTTLTAFMAYLDELQSLPRMTTLACPPP